MATWSVEPYLERWIEETAPDFAQGATTTNGADMIFISGDKSYWIRTIWEFDLSSFPGASSDITAADLIARCDTPGPSAYTIDFRRCQQPALAVAGEVTWNEHSAGNAWDTAGGSPTATDKVTFDSTGSGLQTYPGFATLTIDAIDNRSDILSLINRWTDEADDGYDRDWYVRSTTHPDGPAPKLRITYAAAGGFNMRNYG